MENIHNEIIYAGPEPVKGSRAVIMIHGRGGNAESILSLADHLHIRDHARVAPQAEGNSWYPFSFMAPAAYNEGHLAHALALVDTAVESLLSKGVVQEDIYLLGFSQGACLAAEYAARNAGRYGGLVLFTGGLIGDQIYRQNYQGNFEGTPVFLGTSDPDPHVPLQRVKDSAGILAEMGAKVTMKVYPGMPHTISMEEIKEVNDIIFS